MYNYIYINLQNSNSLVNNLAKEIVQKHKYQIPVQKAE